MRGRGSGGRFLRTLPTGGALVAGAVLALRPRRVVVRGGSMRPTLEPGDRLLLVRPLGLRAGALVAVLDPRQPSRLMVKRVAAIDGCDVTVVGDAPDASTDSRQLGPVPRGSVRGRVVYRYSPPERVGAMLGA